MKGFRAPEVFAATKATGEFAGALGVVAGLRTRIGALGLVVFTPLPTVFFHAFWTLEGPEIRGEHLHFIENLGVAGGCRPGSGSVLARRVTQSPHGGHARYG